jgi:hypothetical protein
MNTVNKDVVDFDFDLAVSFAGENRAYVEDVVRKVGESGDIRVFYDLDYRYDMWGEDGVEYLSAVYMKRARFVVMFIDHHYAEKEWTRLEKKSALARAIQQRSAYILPVRLDDTELDGLLPTLQYISAIREGVDGIVAGIRAKLGSARVPRPSTYQGGIARTPEELQELIAQRPPAWEYVVFGSVLHQRRTALASQRRDHKIRYAAPTGRTIETAADADAAVDALLMDLLQTAEDIDRILDQDVQTDAFGAIGEPGDPDRIIHVADRFMEVYKRFLDLAAELRGARTHPDLRELLERAAAITDRPLDDLDKFLDEYETLVDGITARLEVGENIEMQIVMPITLDDAAMDALREERERIAQIF